MEGLQPLKSLLILKNEAEQLQEWVFIGDYYPYHLFIIFL